MPSRTLSHFIAAFTFINIAALSNVSAQESTNSNTANTPPTATQVVEIKSNGKPYDPRRDDTVTKFVITKEEIEKYGDANIVDILNRQPGIINGQLNGLRGYTQYLIDGQQPPRNFRLEDIQPSQIERIEIIRSAVAEFSTQAIGGTINIVLKRQVHATTRKLQIGISHQDESQFSKRLSINLAEKFSDISYDVAAIVVQYYFGRSSSTSIENADPSLGKQLDQTLITHAYDNSRVYVFNPSLNWKISDSESLQIKARISKVNKKTETKGIRERFNFSYVKLQNEYGQSSWEPQIRYLEGTWSKQLSEDTKLNNKLSANQIAVTSRDQATIALFNSSQRSSFQVIENYKTIVWSGDLAYDPNELESFKSGWKLESTNSSSIESEKLVTKTPSKIQLQNIALFSQKEWKANEVWSHYLGLRWEGFFADISSLGSTQLQKTTTVLSPIAQTRWKDPNNKENQIRFALARTFKNPEASQMITSTLPHLNNDLSLPDIIGNPHLRPEIAWGLDSAFEHFGENELNYSVSHYLKQINYLLRDRLFQSQGRWLQQTINDGNALTYGVMFDTSFPIKLFIKEAPNLNFKANLSRNWSRANNVPGPNNRFAEQAKLNANFDIDYKLNDAWKMGAAYGIVSGGPLRLAADRINIVQVRRTTSTYANWKINKEASLRFSASNLFLEPFQSEINFFNQQGMTKTRTQSRGVMSTNMNLELKF